MIHRLLTKCLNNPIFFRYGFFVLFLLSILVNHFFNLGENHLYIIYIFSLIYLGIGFHNKPTWFLTLFTFLVTTARYLPLHNPDYKIYIFLIHFATYLLITTISAGLMKYVQKVKENNLELIKALSNSLDSRDNYTSYHSENVAKYALQIAKKMNLSSDVCHSIHVGGLLHDIGKIGIPEYILTKPKTLTNDEYELIKTHPKIGYETIKHVSKFKESGILDVVLYHHERFDGKGYPEGLKGEEIPLVARIVAVADTFDAMTSKRVYRNELDLTFTLNEIRNNKGTQFDPEIVDVFLSLFDSQQLSDECMGTARLLSS